MNYFDKELNYIQDKDCGDQSRWAEVSEVPSFFDDGVWYGGQTVVDLEDGMVCMPCDFIDFDEKPNLSLVRSGQSTKVWNKDACFISVSAFESMFRVYNKIGYYLGDGQTSRATGRFIRKNGTWVVEHDVEPLTVEHIFVMTGECPVITLNYMGYYQGSILKGAVPLYIGAPGLYAVDGLTYKNNDLETATMWFHYGTRSVVTYFANPENVTGLVKQEYVPEVIRVVKAEPRTFDYTPKGSDPVTTEDKLLSQVCERIGMTPSFCVRKVLEVLKSQGFSLSDEYCHCGCRGPPDANVLYLGHVFKEKDVLSYKRALLYEVSSPFFGNRVHWDLHTSLLIWQDLHRKAPLPPGKTYAYYYHYHLVAKDYHRGKELARRGWWDQLTDIDVCGTLRAWVDMVYTLYPTKVVAILYFEGIIFETYLKEGVLCVRPPLVHRLPDLFLGRYLIALRSGVAMELHSADRPLASNFVMSEPVRKVLHHRMAQEMQVRERIETQPYMFEYYATILPSHYKIVKWSEGFSVKDALVVLSKEGQVLVPARLKTQVYQEASTLLDFQVFVMPAKHPIESLHGRLVCHIPYAEAVVIMSKHPAIAVEWDDWSGSLVISRDYELG